MYLPEPIPEQYQIPRIVLCACCGETVRNEKLKFHGQFVCGVKCLSHLATGKEHH